MRYYRLSQAYWGMFSALLGERFDAQQIMSLSAKQRRIYLFAAVKLGKTYNCRNNMVCSDVATMVRSVCPELTTGQLGMICTEVTPFIIKMRDGIVLPGDNEVTKLMVAIHVYNEGGGVMVGVSKVQKGPNGACASCHRTVSADDMSCPYCSKPLF